MDDDEQGLFVWTVLVSAFLISAYILAVHTLGTSHFLITIVSDSMEPALYRGDFIVIQNVTGYPVGTIVAFSPRGDLGDVFVHRIVFKRGNSFITKGDNNAYEDRREVPLENVLGKVIFRIPSLGRVNLWLDGK